MHAIGPAVSIDTTLPGAFLRTLCPDRQLSQGGNRATVFPTQACRVSIFWPGDPRGELDLRVVRSEATTIRLIICARMLIVEMNVSQILIQLKENSHE